MAHFLARCQGNRGSVHRLAGKIGSAIGEAMGWDVGGRVRAYHHEGRDVIEFTVTAGSNGEQSSRVIARAYLDENGNYTIERFE